MAPIAITRDATFEYQLKDDRNSDGSLNERGTVFLLRALPQRKRAEIQDRAIRVAQGSNSKEQRFEVAQNTTALDVVDAGVVGWRNWHDEDGKEVQFSDAKRPNTSDMLSEDHIDELSNEISNATSVSPAEGNS